MKDDGFSPWLDEEDLIAGQDWEYEIRNAVRKSEVVVVCLSQNSVAKTGFVQKEIRYALDIADEQPEGAIYIIPLRLDPCSVPESLRKWHWIDYFQDGGYLKLLRAIRASAEKALSATESSIARRKESAPEIAEIFEYVRNLESLVSARNSQFKAITSDLERSYDITLEALGDALDLKGAETEGHSRRVTAFTIAIAQKMGLQKSEIRTIARGAFLHDIGKLAIPDMILTKPGKFTPDEINIMKEHAWYGYKILKRIPFLNEAAEIVYAHQERYDGTGYPRRLKGEEIPLGARIFSIADTLDALTSDRPYRPQKTLQAARKAIKAASGSLFDPKIVEVFLSMPAKIWDDLRKDIEERDRLQRPR
jgi:putative nucleotidyltransferase with HDIG domain